jgi:hypothetical protein
MKDPRMTVRSCEDPYEYHRQWKYLKDHPDCEVIPPPGAKKKPRGRPGHGNNGGKKNKDPRITVTHKDDPREYSRQYGYIRKHPDCEAIPPRYQVKVKDWSPEGEPRITVRRSENIKENNRQRAYIRAHPDCESVPARRHSPRKKKNYSQKKRKPKKEGEVAVPPRFPDVEVVVDDVVVEIEVKGEEIVGDIVGDLVQEMFRERWGGELEPAVVVAPMRQVLVC